MFTFRSRQRSTCCERTSRRNFLRVGGLGMAGLTLPDLLRLRAVAGNGARPKSVIMILLGGGPSHIDTYDMKPDAPVEFRGEFKPVHTNVPGFDICELMPCQAKVADRLALVRNLQMSTSSHNGECECLTGFLWDRRIPGAKGEPRPAFGAVVSRLCGGRTNMPGYVSMMGTREAEAPLYLGAGHRPFVPSGPDLQNLTLSKEVPLERLDDRRALLQSLDGIRRDLDTRGDLQGMDAFQARAMDMLSTTQARDAFDISREPDRVRARYGLTPSLPTYNANYLIWKQFLMARRLVEAGVPMVTLQAFGEWDTHSDNFKSLRRMVPAVDVGVAALVSDLHERGLDQDVAVVMWGEFGRGPRIYSLNGNVPGRDHHGPANFALLAGGGFKTGQVIGMTDAKGERPRGAIVRPQNVLASLYQHLGIDLETTLPDNSGRPMYLLDERAPIAELF